MEFFSLLTSRSALLSIGVCLLLFGTVVRNFARTAQRSRTHDKQLTLHRKSIADTNTEISRDTGAWEKRLPLIAQALLIFGALLIVVGIFRG